MSQTLTLVFVVLLVLLVVALVAFLVARRSKRAGLRDQFGPEYDRTVERSQDKRAAERDLRERADRRRELDIRPLEPAQRDAFAAQWRATQEDFVDRPSEAVADADRLVQEVMRQRGYPVDDAEQMSRDVSVDHAHVVSEYRDAREISELNARRRATTEQLREAMVHYRAMFADLLDAGEHDRPGAAEPYPDETGRSDRERDRR